MDIHTNHTMSNNRLHLMLCIAVWPSNGVCSVFHTLKLLFDVRHVAVAGIMSGGFQFTPNTTASATGGTGVGGFSLGTPSSQMFAFGTPSSAASGNTFGSAAAAASFGAAAGTGSVFGASAHPSAPATTGGFTFGMSVCQLPSCVEFSYCIF